MTLKGMDCSFLVSGTDTQLIQKLLSMYTITPLFRNFFLLFCVTKHYHFATDVGSGFLTKLADSNINTIHWQTCTGRQVQTSKRSSS